MHDTIQVTQHETLKGEKPKKIWEKWIPQIEYHLTEFDPDWLKQHFYIWKQEKVTGSQTWRIR